MGEKITRLSAFLNLHGKLIEITAMIITLVFIAFQTMQMNLNIDEIKKSVVLDSHQAVHEHRQRVNRILLNSEPGLAQEVFEVDKASLVGYTLTTDYESLFNMKCSGLLSDALWHDIETMMHTTLTQTRYMKSFWKERKPSISGRFASYIDELNNSKEANHGQIAKYCLNSGAGV